jgi:predicted nicotinamide N-methyase
MTNLPYDDIRSDAFERSYAIRWLTAVISRIDTGLEDSADEGAASFTIDNKPTASLHEQLLQEAASLLAICAGTAAAGSFTRLFTFVCSQLSTTIQIQLADAPLENNDFSTVGAQTWGGACVLAQLIVDNPEKFCLLNEGGTVLGKQLRVLELGAGTGLVSLVLGKLLEAFPEASTRHATILATDFQSTVLANLKQNVLSNFSVFPSSPNEITKVSVGTHFLDWSTFAEEGEYPFDMPFDLILGADIIYEPKHAIWIKSCLERLLRRSASKTSNPPYLFHLVIPLRSTHMSEALTVEVVFSRVDISGVQSSAEDAELRILSKDIIVCDAHGSPRRDGYRPEEDVEYAYYTIGWC